MSNLKYPKQMLDEAARAEREHIATEMTRLSALCVEADAECRKAADVLAANTDAVLAARAEGNVSVERNLMEARPALVDRLSASIDAKSDAERNRANMAARLPQLDRVNQAAETLIAEIAKLNPPEAA